MNNSEYLSVKEIAEIVECSPQSIYQRLNTTLKDYVKVVKGKKCLKISVLRDIYNIDYQESKQGSKQDIKEFKQDIKDNNELLQSVIETLQEELKEKNKQIETLQKLLDQEQQLHLVEKQNMIEEQKQENSNQELKQENNNVWNKIKQFFIS